MITGTDKTCVQLYIIATLVNRTMIIIRNNTFAHISVKLVSLASAAGNSPEKAFDDRILKMDISSKINCNKQSSQF